MNKVYTLFAFVFSCIFSNAQQFTFEGGQPQKRCAAYEVLQGYRSLHPDATSDAQFENWISQKIEEGKNQRVHAIVTLPLVFHIIHSNETVGTGTNLSAAAIQQQVMQLNKDYANLSYSPYGVSADMEIRFALAQTNPGGSTLAEPGIDRIYYGSAGFTAPPYTVGYASPVANYLNSTIKPATIWDPSKYINVWVLSMESGVLGIATFPNMSGLAGLNSTGNESTSTAGVAVGPTTIGSVFAPVSCGAAYGKGKTLTHELGHFFGLRHIWGDGTCATDYCADTPTHEGANSGVPTHPKSNSCGTADEMFENYMDYTNDAILNTFTADQKARMQAVLTNSPLRNTLSSSTVGLVDPVGNRISFLECSGAATVTETGTTGTYPRYKDIAVVINVENKATGAATVTINTAGTAVNGFHYLLLTPSLVFATGDDSKTINIRIFDNAQVDGNRTLILTYSISGTGVQANSTGQTMTITITDDDNVVAGSSSVTLLSQDFESSVAGWGVLSSGGMPNLWVVSNGGDAGGTGNCTYISNSAGAPYANSYTKTVSGAAVLRSPLINASGISDLQLSFKYKVWGEKVGASTYNDYGLMTYATPAAPTNFTQIIATGAGPYASTSSIISGTPSIALPNGTFANTSFYLGFYWQNNASAGSDPGFNVDDILLTGSITGVGVENTVSSSYGYDVRSGSSMNHFRSTTGKLIADINNPDAAITGLTASVTQAGTGTASLTTGTGSYMRTQKVIQITPSVANTTVNYTGTLYFTTAELAVWAADIPNLKILKVKDGTNLAGSLNSSNSEIITPTFSDQSASGYYTYTGNFTGFSQFMLVTPTTTLPVSLLSFEAKAVRRSIVLNWSTAQELNNKGFGIERSVDGSNFERIGWVAGQVNTSDRTDYSYTDNFVQPGIIYYYRLRQTDIDGKETLSAIRQAKIDQGGNILFTISPNPAKDRLNLFISGSSHPADVQLVNMQGQAVRNWRQVNASATAVPLDISGLASGVYMLWVRLPGQALMENIVIR